MYNVHCNSTELSVKHRNLGGGGGGGGVQGQKSWKHDFEIIGDPKGPPSGSTFWSGFEAPGCRATPFFRAQKFKMAYKAQNQDFPTPIDR